MHLGGKAGFRRICHKYIDKIRNAKHPRQNSTKRVFSGKNAISD